MGPTVLFAARLMPPVGGGIEQLSDDVLHALRENFEVVDLANRGARWTQFPYLATIGERLRLKARRLKSVVVDGGDATLSPALVRSGAPSIVRVQGLDLLLPNPIYQRVIRKYLPRVNVICPCSGPTAAILKGFNVPAERIHVVHPAADAPPGWEPAAEPGRMLFVGRLVERKGLREFVEQVWPGVAREIPHAQLRVVGDGPDRPRIERAVASAPANDRIHLLGALPRASLEDEFRQADLLVMPNRPRGGDFEGFGIVAIEAAVRGVPVVARAVDGVVDAVVPERTGLLVRDDAATAMADELLRVLERRALGDRHAIMSEAKARYGSQRLAKTYAEVVERTGGAYATS